MPVTALCPRTRRPVAQHQRRHGRAAIGAALGAEKLILCTGTRASSTTSPTRLRSPYTDLAGLKRMREEGKIVDGMLPR
jgi:hypothetical protein